MKIRIFPVVICLFIYVANAQDFKKPLLTINNEKIAADEFLRIYQKNLTLIEDEGKNEVEQYLETFIDYKLKVAEARRQGFHEKESYKKELEGYKTELVKNYMTDTQASEKLLQEAYERLQKEVSASHILVRIPSDARPADTLQAFTKISKLRNLATSSNFDSLRKAVHNGKTVIGEDLGYFSVFRMVYPFENETYQTAEGEISKPFRTRFGYHFVKINDKRTNRGEVEVAHIMIADSGDLSTKGTAEKRILDIYKRLEQGGSFEDLARQFSDDKGSAIREGRLPKFAAGRLNSKLFEDKAFNVSPGKITEPFKTRYGWHIMKGVKKYPIGAFEEERAKLQTLLEKDMRSKILSKTFITKLKNKYNFKANYEVRDAIIKLVNSDFYKRQWSFDKTNPLLKEEIFKIRDTVWEAGRFASWIRQAQFKLPKGVNTVNFEQLFNDFSETALLKYHKENLENENQEFASILKEYREGLLLFDIMQEEVWDAARTDSTGLRDFYHKNKKQYYWNKRVKILIASFTKADLTANLKSLMQGENNIAALRKFCATIPELNKVIFTASVMEIDDYRLPEGYKPSNDWFEEKTSSGFRLIKTINVIKPEAKSFQESKGAVMNDYQNYLEKEWLRSLRDAYRIKVNTKQLRKLKKRLDTK